METWKGRDENYGSLYVKHCGWETCEPAHRYGPAVRDHILIHFVASGHGRFQTQDREYALGPGHVFAIFPDQVTTYWADEKRPWTYGWVGYSGDDAKRLTRQAGLTKEEPVAVCMNPALAETLLRTMLQDASQMRMGALSALGSLYRFLALLCEAAKSLPEERQAYYEKALWFMNGHYERDVSIEEVAAFVGLSRSQLFRVFKQAADVSPKESLTAIRAQRARTLIETTDLNAEEVAASIGVSSPQRLNLVLKQAYHMTLTQIRKG